MASHKEVRGSTHSQFSLEHQRGLSAAWSQRSPKHYADHLNTPRLVADATATTVWRWDQAEPFGVNAANEDPDGNSVAFDLPLRLPGQYYDKETEDNLKKHKIAFDKAVTVFYDPLAATFDDPDHSVGERRLVTIGYSSQDQLLVVVHTEFDSMIMKRKATIDLLFRFVSFVFGGGFLLGYVWFPQGSDALTGFAAGVALLGGAVLPWKILRALRHIMLLLGLVWVVHIVWRQVPRFASQGWPMEDVTLFVLPILLHIRVLWHCYASRFDHGADSQVMAP